MGKSDPPPPVDYEASANAQGAANKATAISNSNLNRVNQYTPQGSSIWSTRPGSDPANPQAGDFTQTTSLSPELQNQFDASQRVTGSLLGTAENQLGKVSNSFNNSTVGQGLQPFAQAPQNTISAVGQGQGQPQGGYSGGLGQSQGGQMARPMPRREMVQGPQGQPQQPMMPGQAGGQNPNVLDNTPKFAATDATGATFGGSSNWKTGGSMNHQTGLFTYNDGSSYQVPSDGKGGWIGNNGDSGNLAMLGDAGAAMQVQNQQNQPQYDNLSAGANQQQIMQALQGVMGQGQSGGQAPSQNVSGGPGNSGAGIGPGGMQGPGGGSGGGSSYGGYGSDQGYGSGGQSNYEQSRQAVTNSLLARAEPLAQQDQESMRNQLINSGFQPGSEGYNRQMLQLSQKNNDMRSQAIFAGGAEQSRLNSLNNENRGLNSSIGIAGQNANNAQNSAAYGQGLSSMNANNANRQSQLQEQSFLQNIDLNNLNALRSGSQVGTPQFGSYYTNNAAAAPLFDAASAQGQANATQHASNQASDNATTGAVGSLAMAAAIFF